MADPKLPGADWGDVPDTAPPEGKERAGEKSRRRQRIREFAMIGRYGAGPADRTCGDCCWLVKHSYTRNYYKCQMYGDSSSEATDWRKKWKACSKFQERTNERATEHTRPDPASGR